MSDNIIKYRVSTEHLEYLDALRESGEINMFGAPSRVVGRFGVKRSHAIAIVSQWMETFEDRHPEPSPLIVRDGEDYVVADDDVIRELPEF